MALVVSPAASSARSVPFFQAGLPSPVPVIMFPTEFVNGLVYHLHPQSSLTKPRGLQGFLTLS